MPELGSLGSVRGALRNERPYRECGNSATVTRGRNFVAYNRADPKKSRNSVLCATIGSFASSFRTVCKSFGAAPRSNEIKGAGCSKSQVRKSD